MNKSKIIRYSMLIFTAALVLVKLLTDKDIPWSIVFAPIWIPFCMLVISFILLNKSVKTDQKKLCKCKDCKCKDRK